MHARADQRGIDSKSKLQKKVTTSFAEGATAGRPCLPPFWASPSTLSIISESHTCCRDARTSLSRISLVQRCVRQWMHVFSSPIEGATGNRQGTRPQSSGTRAGRHRGVAVLLLHSRISAWCPHTLTLALVPPIHNPTFACQAVADRREDQCASASDLWHPLV